VPSVRRDSSGLSPHSDRHLFCHSREGGNPKMQEKDWIPACAGMTKNYFMSRNKKAARKRLFYCASAVYFLLLA
jgi:hypothetical protein